MMNSGVTKSDILAMIKDGRLSVEEGVSLLKGSKQKPKDEIKKTDIAVVGISLRVPGATNTSKFWENLKNGVDSVGEISKNRWKVSKEVMEEIKRHGNTLCKWAGELKDYDKFDPLFFNISPLEAEAMDPQQRIFLEECWRAIEDAGINPADLSDSRCGVFAGVAQGDYAQNLRANKAKLDAQVLNGGQNSILGARISYYLNLTGPNITVDTACSSSLVATHMAYQSIINGESDIALAGGVNILSTADMNIMTSNGKMLSKDGRCKAFDELADGFVLSEAAAVLVLMPLKKAVEEHYSIYGVIKGSAVNQDGKTNGITAPSAKSQTKLELEVYKRYGINPEQISYVEAHGTGTKLGDPIEVTALTNSFREYTDKKNYCALGSSKTNIGHALTVSGTIGLIKVLLCLKHKKLVPSLHFNKLNEHIHLEDSPFYVNTQYKDWEQNENGSRLAAVSSFGLSGTNCHIVVEEGNGYQTEEAKSELPAYLFTLSAKTMKSLKGMIAALVNWLNNEENNESLQNISYTLNVGRMHFDYRLIVKAASKEELKEKLEKVIRQEQYLDSIEQKGDDFQEFEMQEEELAQILHSVKNEDDYAKVLKLIAHNYINGASVPWFMLYENMDCTRISLPAYEFMKEHYWLDDIDHIQCQNGMESIHPLITFNKSTFNENRYVLRLTGEEEFLVDHQVNKKMVFPGAAYLEMARAAAEYAGEAKVTRIENVVWLKEISPESYPVDISIHYYYRNEQFEYEVSTCDEEQNRYVHSVGKFLYGTQLLEDKNQIYDIETLKARMNLTKLTADSAYKMFEAVSVKYGESFQTMKEIWKTDHEALVRLELSEEYREHASKYQMYPGLLDGALHSAMALGNIIDMEHGVCAIPFQIEEINMYDRIPDICYSYVTFSKDSPKDIGMKKYDILILDQEGRLTVSLKGVVSRTFKKETPIRKEETGKAIGFEAVWKQDSGLTEAETKNRSIIVLDKDESQYNQLIQAGIIKENTRLVLAGEDFSVLGKHKYQFDWDKERDYVAFREQLVNEGVNDIYILNLSHTGKEAHKEELENALLQIHYFTKAFMRHSFHKKIEYSMLVRNSGNECMEQWSAIGGYGRTTIIELPNLFIRSVVLDQNADVKEVVKQELLVKGERDFEVAYQGSKRVVKIMHEIHFPEKLDINIFADNSVIVISGGAGGLGLLTAEHIVRKAKASIILLGRSVLSEEKKERINRMEQNGSKVMYMQCDITDQKELEDVLAKIRTKFGKINGIIHSAGVLQDSLINRKTDSMLLDVALPKMKGALNLDVLTKDDNLDFFICYSAIASVFGNAGQCDYSYANSFLDHYMEKREALRRMGMRKGNSYSVNWPLWANGGMNISEDVGEALYQRIGMRALDDANGFKFIEYILSTEGGQFMVIYGQEEAIRKAVENNNQPVRVKEAEEKKEQEHIEVDTFKLREATEKYLTEVFAKVLRISASRIKPQAELEQYGIDSLIIIKVNEELEKIFGKLSSTLLFEYKSIRELSQYFIEEFKEPLSKILGLKQDSIQPVEKVRMEEPKSEPVKVESVKAEPARKEPVMRKEEKSFVTPEARKGDVDIAVIGISGKYPMAENLDEFWENLKSGKDCIEEIPSDRWDYRDYFNPDKNHEGTTYSKWGGFLKEIDKFDPLFFNISPKEAELMDPQERLFLESVWECMERAGYHKSRLAGKDVGVFVGVMYGGYQLYGIDECNKGNMVALNSSFASIANRISYYFDLSGSSVSVDTMCSSALTALHLGCESIQRGDNDMIIVGGVNLISHPNKYLLLSQGKFMSTDGRCRAFGEGGDGYVPGEGVGAVLLKPLEQAKKDGDQIYAVIKGTALNHGGKTNGYTVPNPNAQAKVIDKVLKKTGIHPRTISYIEAHGTGTSLGDPIEIAGLSKAYGKYTTDRNFCSIGSVKSNIGHSESAAGIAALTKVILQLRNKKLVPSIHSDVLNEKIDFQNSSFYVQHSYEDWKRPVITLDGEIKEYPLRAAISSFGAGGSNAHVILEEYIEENASLKNNTSQSKMPAIMLLSAKNEQRLKLYANELLKFVKDKKNGTNGTTHADSLQIISKLKQMLAEILNTEAAQIDVDEKLCELGMEVFLLNQYIEKINTWYHITLPCEYISNETTVRTLAEYVQKMEAGNCECSELNLLDIAYTLMVGREAMEERISFVVNSTMELEEALKAYCNNETDSNVKLYKGNTKKSQVADMLLKSRAGQEYLRVLKEDKEYAEIAQLWVQGIDFSWENMFEGEECHLIELPVHPFMNRRYWIGSFQDSSETEITSNAAPLVKHSMSRPLKPAARETKVDQNWLAKIEERRQLWEERSKSYSGNEVTLEIVEESIAVVALNDRENRNTFSDQLVMGLIHRFDQIKKNNKIKAVVVTGYDNVFCMGGTQEQLIDISNQKNKFTDTPFMFLGLLQCEVPVIAAIQGHASGGGLLFGLYSDIVVLSEEGVYSAVFMKYGFTPGMGATYILEQKFGRNLATEMMYTARGFRGEELRARGASVLVRPKNDVLDAALTVAKHLADKPVNSLKVLKNELSSRTQEKLLECIQREELMHDKTFTTQEVKDRIGRYYRSGVVSGDAKKASATSMNQNVVSQKAPVTLKRKAELEEPVRVVQEVHTITPSQERKTEPSRAKVMSIVGKILHIREAELNVETGFKDLGVDSISGLEIVREVNKEFGLELDSVIIYDYPTVQALSDYIDSLMSSKEPVSNPVENEHNVWGIKKKKTVKIQPQPVVQEERAESKTVKVEQSQQDILDQVKRITEKILHVNEEDLNVETGFKDLGVDSISGLEIVREINKAFDLELDSVIIYDYPTIEELATYVKAVKGDMATIAEPVENAHGTWGITKKKVKKTTEAMQYRTTEETAQIIQKVVGKVVHIPVSEVPMDAQFKELGVDSISGVEIIRDVNKEFQAELDAIIIYDYPTIKELAEYVSQNCPVSVKAEEQELVKEVVKPAPKLKLDRNVLPARENQTTIEPKKKLSLKQAPKAFPSRERQVGKIKLNRQESARVDTIAEEKTQELTLSQSAKEVHFKETKKEETGRKSTNMEIAVVGMSGRFPGADNLDGFWSNLCEGKDSIEPIPKERWDNSLYYSEDLKESNKTYCTSGGFLKDIDEFDPLFFHISPMEARYMDPQQRIFLQECWKALENAGYSNKALSNLKCGVFVGVTQGDYSRKMGEAGEENTAEAFAGVSSSILAARISYFLNLKGPSISMDTACSSSLVAIHQACQSIQSGDSDMALAGGVRLMLTPGLMLQTSKMQMLSIKGKCKPFDADADGTMLGEGVGVIVLKPLEKAIEDGDYIYGVIKSSGINQDGKTNGITAPSAQSQKNLELDVYKKGNINPRDITLIETHGTGTKLGDPIEVKALTEAFSEYTKDKQFCAIGSVKSNIGHTTMSAGVASMIKMLLCLKNKKIVPTVNYENPNPLINFKDSPFYVADRLQDWKSENGKPRLGAVSAFGMSGTNCHIVVGEAPDLDY